MNRNMMRKALTYILLGFWSLVCAFPLYWMAITSFKREADIEQVPRYVPYIDFTPQLDSWKFILFAHNENLSWSLFNSSIVALCATALTIGMAAMAVYAATRLLHGRGQAILFAMIATRILPPVATVIPVYAVMHRTGLLDSRTGLILGYVAMNLPVALWLMRPCFGTRATEQEEAARLDGASHAAVLFSILLPMHKAAFAAVSLMVFILCWNEYLYATLLTTDNAMTLPGYLMGQMSMKEAQVASEAEEWAHFSAAAVLIAAPVLLFAGFVQRHAAFVPSQSAFRKPDVWAKDVSQNATPVRPE
jgi:ABC-type glycerol-3-phosphate transport system permease component